MQAPESNKITKALGLAFARTLTTTVSATCASSWEAEVAENVATTISETTDSSFFKFTFTGSLQGEAVLAVQNTELITLDLKDIETPDAPITAYIRAFQATLDDSVRAMTKLLLDQGPITIHVESVDLTELPGEYIAELRLTAQEPERQLAVLMAFDQDLLSSALASPAMIALFPELANLSAANLGLVLDVELNVTLRFGQRQLPLREVLDLSSGSVVELDRQVDEPVELVLDGRVVARGEAVIIDGNYGMRITEMLQQIVA